MRRLPLFLLVSFSCLSQTKPEITFIRQSPTLPAIDEYEIAVCNRSPSPLTVDPVDVRVYAFQAGISAASHASLLKAIEEANRHSFAYYGALTTEILAWGMTVVVSLDRTNENGEQTGPIKIRSRVKALLPVGASLLSFSRYLIDRERRPVSLPDNLLPVLPFSLPASSCQSYAFYGVAK